MKSVYLQTALGLILLISGIQSIYSFVKSIDEGANIFFIILSLILIIAGVWFLMNAGKSDSTVFKRINNLGKKKSGINSLEQTLEKNNQLSEEWNKTIEKKDKLRMLEISTAAAADVKE